MMDNKDDGKSNLTFSRPTANWRWPLFVWLTCLGIDGEALVCTCNGVADRVMFPVTVGSPHHSNHSASASILINQELNWLLKPGYELVDRGHRHQHLHYGWNTEEYNTFRPQQTGTALLTAVCRRRPLKISGLHRYQNWPWNVLVWSTEEWRAIP